MRLDQIKEMTKLTAARGPLDEAQKKALLAELGMGQMNLYQELEMSSRLVNTHRDVSQRSDYVQLHSHTFYEILFIRSGGGVQYLVGTERYLLRRGDVIIVPPGIAHRPLLTGDLSEPYRRDVLWLSQEFVQEVMRQFHHGEPELGAHMLLRTADSPWEELLRERFRLGVREEEEKMPGWEPMVLGNTVQLMVMLYRAMRDQGRAPSYVETPELLEEVLAYIERHLADRITLADAAQRFFVSESKISQTFREKMGVSFHRCLNQRRLIAAKNLIAEGLPLEQVGEKVGFPEYSTFYRAFRQEFGISPRQYRKMQAE